ncbi:MAG TPA: signal peptide peptidase SppA [Candidatus Acidoferrales bacterium]|nr:signal peptide peptidase SppA [Candidatus Acidoferrales bacterium]
MSKVIVRFLAILGALWLIGMAIVLLAVIGMKGKVPSKTILEANFEGTFMEEIPNTPSAQLLLSEKQTLRDVVDAIDRGAGDDRVVGMIARIGAAPMGMAQTQEIRDAVQRFRAHKKFAVAYSETFGEFGPGNGAYYLATAFDHIYLQPSGDVGLTGIILESPFIKGTLSKLGMTFHGDHRYEYKTALNFYTETKYTGPDKEAMTAIVTSWFNQMKEGICQARHIAPEKFQALVDAGPYLGKEAVTAQLVDAVAYRDEVYNDVKSKAGDGAELLYLDKYLARAGSPHDRGKTVALVFGVGDVTRGKSDYDPVHDSQNMGSDTVAGAIRTAAEDKDVKAILFRVDSPGGSYVASDTIWREVARARRTGKPVIVSMGNLAGSGGYFVAMAADKIVAEPGTITASIGVLGGKMLTSGLWDKVGFSWDEVHQGENATMFTGTHDYTPAEWARFEAWLDRVYVDFTGKAADGRKLPKEKVLEIAKGRIWSGQDAKNLGLVDELGGYDTALKLAKQAAGVPEGEDVKIVVYPRPKTFFQSVIELRGPDNSDKEAVGQTLARILEVVQPVARHLDAAGIKAEDKDKDQDDVLRMNPVPSSR